MLHRLKRLLQTPDAAVAPPVPPVPERPVETAEAPVPVGLVDMSLSGWFRNDTGELIEGFPIGADDSVLDIGCGDGGFTLFAGRQGAEIFVADINQSSVDTAVARVRETAARAVHPLVTDANPIPLEDGRVNRVIAMEVLEHVEDPARFLAELVRVARPGSLFLLTVPDAFGEKAQQGIAPDSYFQQPNHIHIFERERFETLVREAGLEVERRTTYGFYRTLWWFFYWASGQPTLSPPWHPLLEHWDRTWGALLSLPQGQKVKAALDEVMPKSQVIIARKPGVVRMDGMRQVTR
ncbi:MULTISPECIES: bifunctional 2-polyprenyl-6-hydroxyphenol methylase/3-demethylubiquinol 3-O-methyltransferase UbiG [Pseudomonas]|jgi:SAM-dependent methyltransferase|uniref:class I SAM-dependent methyltransferase n=1 Tax=Pseudomonas TaxID=286 RepID=UPI0004D943B0|nr:MULTISPECIES: class I SAM-dependent methyltransferase [Pseudomonas]KES23733.1 methyltransferase [Pseudomonas sp. AAC]KWR72340.1 methyltransferase [Pseudomonas sp. PI1]MBH3433952.1 class I SAM-dependent methyltransferase [Pseudomonas citronellolis]OHR75989.1 methyltransferase [Pseudomonas sp. HMSC75E02]WAB94150.1 class I SAM-dependent methyltransferase [Pseudomonas citronellolis]